MALGLLEGCHAAHAACDEARSSAARAFAPVARRARQPAAVAAAARSGSLGASARSVRLAGRVVRAFLAAHGCCAHHQSGLRDESGVARLQSRERLLLAALGSTRRAEDPAWAVACRGRLRTGGPDSAAGREAAWAWQPHGPHTASGWVCASGSPDRFLCRCGGRKSVRRLWTGAASHTNSFAGSWPAPHGSDTEETIAILS